MERHPTAAIAPYSTTPIAALQAGNPRTIARRPSSDAGLRGLPRAMQRRTGLFARVRPSASVNPGKFHVVDNGGYVDHPRRAGRRILEADIIHPTDLRPSTTEITMGEAIEELAHFVAGTPWEAIPEVVREHAKLVLLDTLGVILAGSIQSEVADVRARLTATGGRGATVYAPGSPTTDPRTAALLNGLAGRSIELCEGHRYVSCQGAVQVLPTALASAEWLERSGRETLAALIFGYEVAARLGAGLTSRPLAHQNGQAPLLGAVGAGARLRGLNRDQTSLALRIGAILLLTPAYTNAVAGATALNVAGGMSGFAGTLAPELALAGVAAQPNAIEESLGQLVGDGFRPEAVTQELGQRWEIHRNYFRLRACCNPIYAALDALEEILADLRPHPDSIARIEVATYRFAANMREPDPVNYFAAKYSLPHAAAALVLRGNAGYHAFTEEAVRDPAIAAFRRRVDVREDPALNAHVPRLKPARVTVTFTDGRKETRSRESARGDFQNPYGEGEVRAKFRELARVVLSPAGVARLESLVDRLDDLPRLSDLVVALREDPGA
jgi:2-methylcitrate dehydratase PrpD